MRVLVLTAVVSVLTLAASDAGAESRAMKVCQAKWEAYIHKLPALPPPGRKAQFIKTCMKTTSNAPVTRVHPGYGSAGAVNPPDPDKGLVNPPDPDKVATPH
ncbi:MAG TPA: hypothetical protein VGL66_12030 [Caulobacteraceae bacterium]|jgi:hypothetical protein